MNTGRLYIVGTPIGNLEDITLRAIRILKEVDVIAAEDTRHTRKLLTHYDIHTPLTSYHGHNATEKAPVIVAKMKEGLSVALVSDAGTPGISDPGSVLVLMCMDEGIPVTPIPGPSAVTAAMPASGLLCDRFVFEGFMPSRSRERRKRLEQVSREERPLVFFESPHRLLRTLRDMHEVLGDRDAALCREITKIHEEITKMPLSELIGRLEKGAVKGEITLVVAGAQAVKAGHEAMTGGDARPGFDDQALATALKKRIESGMDKKEAIRAVAKETGAPRKTVYAAALKM